MRATSLRIENIATLEEVEIELGQVTTVEGRNGEGKSSVLDAVKSAFGGGTDATLLTVGATEGRVCLLLSDGTKLTREFKPGKSSLRVDHPDFGRIAKPQSFVETLADLAAVNPVSFLAMPAKKRAEYLLEVCPIEVDAQGIRGIVQGILVAVQDGAYSGLDLIDQTRRTIFNLRTGVNGAAKEKRATVAQLVTTLPAGASQPEAIEGDLADVRDRVVTVQGDLNDALDNLHETASCEARDWNKQRDMEHDELLETDHRAMLAIEDQMKELERQLDELIRQGERRMSAFNAETERARTERNDAYKAKVAALKAESAPKLAELQAAEVRLQEAARHAAGHQKTRDLVGQYTEEAAHLEERSEQMTEAIAQLDTYRTSLLASLPIPGLEVRDGEIYREGVPFDRLNTAQRIDIAYELAKLRLGSLRLMVVDGVECLDSESLAHLEAKAAADDVQLLLARVTDGELSVRCGADTEEATA